MKKNNRAFTLIELLVVISIIALLLGILLPALGRAQQNAKKIQDGTQVRGIMTSMVQFASDSGGSFPLPDRFDNNTVAGPSVESENRTGSILSMMVSLQTIVPELCVSPSEAGQIVPYEEYEFTEPRGAFNPPAALYDPKMKGSPVDKLRPGNVGTAMMAANVGHNSYAHMAIAGARTTFWSNSLSSATPIWANRGPVYNGTMTPLNGMDWELSDTDELGTSSTSLFIHGSETRWEGNIAFADGHVDYATEPNPSSATFLDNQTGSVPITQNDNLFVDEQNEGSAMNPQVRRNAYLRIFSQGIPTTTAVTNTVLQAGPSSMFVWVDGINS